MNCDSWSSQMARDPGGVAMVKAASDSKVETAQNGQDASANADTAFAADGTAVPLALLEQSAGEVLDTVLRVTPEEFRWQESHYDINSRSGRELLFLIANHEWVR